MTKHLPFHQGVCIFFLLLTQHLLFSQTTVTNDRDLRDKVNAASPGDVFIVKNGTYKDFEARFSDAKGAPGNPIIVKAETVGGVTFTRESVFSLKKCEYIVLEGFVFDCEGDNSLIKLEGSNNIRITRNVFELKTNEPIKWVFIGGIYNDYTFQHTSHHNRIDHNIFQNKTTPGHYITVDGTSNESGSDSRQSQYDRIDHNYFKNNGPRARNEKESIRIGWSQMSKSKGFTTVEHNLFEDCDGDPEIVSVKSSNNIIRHNTFRRSYGSLVLRHGNNNRVEGNYFFGGEKPNGTFGRSTIYTGGIRVYGTDHVIINNYMQGLKGTRWDAPITLTQGDAIDGNSSNLTKHFRAERVTIAYNTLVDNTYGIEIGFDKGGDYRKRLKDVTIANNIVTGSENNLVRYIDGNDQKGGVKWINNIMFPKGDASLVNGGPDFTSDQVTVTDPNLSQQGGIWKATQTTPILPNGIPELTINQDIEGQDRPAESTIGADHFGSGLVRYKPLTPNDVGPNSDSSDNPPTSSLTLGSISEFSPASGSQMVSVTSNVSWTVTDNKDWITVTPDSGNNNGTLTINVEENTQTDKRTGIVTVTDGLISRQLEVVQSGKPAGELTISANTLEFQSDESVKEFTITSDLSWTISKEENWINVSPVSGTNNQTITVTVSENIATSARSGIITIVGGTITKTVSITQNGSTADDGAQTITISNAVASDFQPGKGPENTLDKNLTTRWSAQGIGKTITYDLGSFYNLSLIQIAFHKGAERKTTFDIAVSEDGENFNTIIADQVSSGKSNNLEGFVLSSKARYVRIVGKGNSSGNGWNSITEVEISGSLPPSLVVGSISEFSFASGSQTFSVTSNISWTVTDDQDWITVTPDSGSNNGTLTVTVEANTQITSRTGVITVTNGSISEELTVTQQGKPAELTVSTDSLQFESGEITKMFAITSNIEWAVSDDQNWISLSSASGANDKTITVSVLNNTTGVDRSGEITITGGTITKKIAVLQKNTTVDGDNLPINISSVVASAQHEQNTPDNTIDKNLDTRWSAKGVGQTITYDLGNLYDLNLIQIAFHKGDERTSTFDIAVSEDGESFSTIITDQSSSGNSINLENFEVTSKGRYVRIVGKGNSSGNGWNSLTEVEIRGKKVTIVNDETGDVVLAPLFDSYIRGGVYSNTSYDTQKDLWVKRPSGSSTTYRRNALLSFDISSLEGTVTSAKLILVPVAAGNTASELTTEVYASDDFDENVTYAQKPSTSDLLDTKKGGFGVGNEVEYEITEYINSKVASGKNRASVSINSKGGDATGTYVRFASKESSNTDYVPKLVINTDVSATSSNNSLSQPSQVSKISIYPQPAYGRINLQGVSAYNKIYLFDLKGRLLREFDMTDATDDENAMLRIDDISKGIYLLRFLGPGTKDVTRKVMIN